MLTNQLDLFSTPLFVFDLPDTSALNSDLASRLLDEAESSPSFYRSNSGGWHSAPDLSGRTHPGYATLIQSIVDKAAYATGQLAENDGRSPGGEYRFSAVAWAMVMRNGDYINLHDHGDAHWSSVYYVDAGDVHADEQSESGLLALVDPRRSSLPLPGVELARSTFTVRPRAGLLALFPGWLQHYVHPYRGERPRISISCNLRLEPD